MKLLLHFDANVASSSLLHLFFFKLMPKVAGLIPDGLAGEAVENGFFITVVAEHPEYFIFPAGDAYPRGLCLSRDESEVVPLAAQHGRHQPVLVPPHLSRVPYAVSAQPHRALPIEEKAVEGELAPHAEESELIVVVGRGVDLKSGQLLQLVVPLAGSVAVELKVFTGQTVLGLALLAILGSIDAPQAQAALLCSFVGVAEGELEAARAHVVDVDENFRGEAFIQFGREFGVARVADAKVTAFIIVDSLGDEG